jgi:hypothetical protein
MGLIEMVTTGSARGQDCTGVLHFVLNRQPALRTLLLHASHASCAAAGGGSEEVVASEAVVGQVVEALQQRYTPQMLTIERLDSSEQAGEGMSSLVRHAVEQVVSTVKAQKAYHYICVRRLLYMCPHSMQWSRLSRARSETAAAVFRTRLRQVGAHPRTLSMEHP